ncbi:hypothetical protein QBC40DRAFT_292325 [Triangularia verruculosa]|uniref:Uncharacterized protein n=1 Tax=Triangularia verruculosa TaxID=2587418 RepID=A0AAN7AZA6_9PEZI|nr:hypothetical protein QBC40DRAFT_292325 [Triangularia verruculosa]
MASEDEITVFHDAIETLCHGEELRNSLGNLRGPETTWGVGSHRTGVPASSEHEIMTRGIYSPNRDSSTPAYRSTSFLAATSRAQTPNWWASSLRRKLWAAPQRNSRALHWGASMPYKPTTFVMYRVCLSMRWRFYLKVRPGVAVGQIAASKNEWNLRRTWPWLVTGRTRCAPVSTSVVNEGFTLSNKLFPPSVASSEQMGTTWCWIAICARCCFFRQWISRYIVHDEDGSDWMMSETRRCDQPQLIFLVHRVEGMLFSR